MATIAELFQTAVYYHQRGDFQQAESSYRMMLQTDPTHAAALSNLGVLLQISGRAALRLNPNYADAHYNLGNALFEQGKLDESAKSFRQTLAINPNHANAHHNLGTILKEKGQFAEAAACYRQALRVDPNHLAACNNLGNVLQKSGQLREAITCFQHVLRLNPGYAPAYFNLGNALAAQGQLADAAESFRHALHFDATDVNIHNNLGNLLADQGEFAAAAESYRNALFLKPNCATYQLHLLHQLQHMCLWPEMERLALSVIDAVEKAGQTDADVDLPPFPFLTMPIPTNAAQQFLCTRLHSWKLAGNVKHKPAPPWQNRRAKKDKITLGYLSGDFQNHATAYLIAELFELHDRQRFRVLGYSLGPDDGGPMRRRLAASFDRFVDLKEASDEEAARHIASDEVDILIDLKGYTKGARTQIPASRPAPIQINYLGYPGTMGAPYIDYILVDDFVVPPDQQPFFSERLVHLPGCYQVNDSRREIAAQTPTRAACKLPDNGFIFCSFNRSYKITPRMFAVWMELLKAVPGSVLWLLESNRFAVLNLRRAAEELGVSGERLIFAPDLPLAEHLARYRLADLFLDCFPVNGHTTASDALWAGCPVLTVAGETFVSRVAGSLLRAIGLPELIANSIEDYQSVALRLVCEPESLASLRDRLAEGRNNSRLFDAERFARNLERAYEAMWATYLSREKPQAFTVVESAEMLAGKRLRTELGNSELIG